MYKNFTPKHLLLYMYTKATVVPCGIIFLLHVPICRSEIIELTSLYVNKENKIWVLDYYSLNLLVQLFSYLTYKPSESIFLWHTETIQTWTKF